MTKEEIAIYNKAYRGRNKEKRKAWAKEYRKQNKEKLKRQRKVWCQRNKLKVAAAKKAYAERHKKHIAAYKKAYRERYREELNVQAKDWYKRNKRRTANEKRQYEYGLTPEAFKEMFLAQQAKCAICEKRFTKRQDVHIDHCHDFNKVRALLCSKCNCGIGMLNHNSKVMRNAADYVEKWHHDHLIANQKNCFTN